jgi:hypothetical protein
MDLDFLKKLAGMGGDDLGASAASRYGDAYSKAGKLGKLGMRLASMPQEEMDLSSTVSLKPRMPTGMDPRRMYGDLYSSYGGRKMRGLLFD